MQKKADSGKSTYVPSNSKSSTMSGSQKDAMEGQPSGFSEFDIPKSTLYVVGSNPGEPKMSYPDPPKKMSKTVSNCVYFLCYRKANKPIVHLMFRGHCYSWAPVN